MNVESKVKSLSVSPPLEETLLSVRPYKTIHKENDSIITSEFTSGEQQTIGYSRKSTARDVISVSLHAYYTPWLSL